MDDVLGRARGEALRRPAIDRAAPAFTRRRSTPYTAERGIWARTPTSYPVDGLSWRSAAYARDSFRLNPSATSAGTTSGSTFPHFPYDCRPTPKDSAASAPGRDREGFASDYNRSAISLL